MFNSRIVDLQHWRTRQVMLAGHKTWERLRPQFEAILQTCANDVELYCYVMICIVEAARIAPHASINLGALLEQLAGEYHDADGEILNKVFDRAEQIKQETGVEPTRKQLVEMANEMRREQGLPPSDEPWTGEKEGVE